MKIARNDIVEVISGDSKGQQGRVLKVDKAKNRITVEKVRLVKRHRKQVQGQATGGIVEMEAPIDISNVRMVSKGTRDSAKG
ncbi:50S ribosomal protein L24 [bacterium]|nr:MAG: 50S ribosomal protein L24 [bacterium]